MSRASQYFSLDPEIRLLKRLGDPHKDLKYVHVAGTNGKGSTSAFIASILKNAGYKAGCFTSPYFCSPREMIRINGEAISEKSFEALLDRVRKASSELKKEGISVSEYEIYTALAFLYYQQEECDITVMEVCMGGSVDCTNVIPAPLVTVMVPISFDHMGVLGDTLTEIASEKAGIIKPGTMVVSAPQEDEVRDVLDKTCKDNEVPIRYAEKPETIQRSLSGQIFRSGNDEEYETSLLGVYQPDNAALALLAADALKVRGFSVSDEAKYNGIKNTRWFGRFTVIQSDPPVVADGGHNSQGASALRESLETYFPGEKIIFILGILRDKEVDKMLEILLPIAKEVYCTKVPNERTMDPKDLALKIEKNGVPAQVINGVAEYKSIAEKNSVTCIAGSLYLLGELYK
ncbi:MAG: bifunctional folylpolyglutamate synthase/dihydrofolate synthase [Lachnospiraceae bacterium]|nr:bifunctional folylpolyglutamate synthase/dihydrofolate synthase [Lachnospiraceae bacterium]